MPVSSSANHGLETSRRALQAQQAALNIAGHNIANANTPGFSRRRAELVNAVSGLPPHPVGSGADVVGVERLRSGFLDAQMRVEQQVLGRWEATEKALGGIEAIFNEPAGAGSSEAGTVFNEASGLGLSGSLSRFWNAWQDLANVPESGAARAAVRQEAEFMSTTLHQIDARLRQAGDQLDREFEQEIEAINTILEQVAALNAEIPRGGFAGSGGGDLEDRRDLLLEELANKVDISTIEEDNGQIAVVLSGHKLVEGSTAIPLGTRRLTGDGFGVAQAVYSDDGSVVPISEGRLRGLIDIRDEILPNLVSRMDEMAAGIVTAVNTVHRASFTRDGASEIDFFDPDKTNAANIELAEAIVDDLDNIAASADGNNGDNGAALAISGLRNETVLAGNSDTIDGFYLTILGEVGARSKEAQTMAGNHRLFATQLENRRQSVQGVSLNDEAAQLVLFQRAYQAAARMVSVIDNLMEVTVNM